MKVLASLTLAALALQVSTQKQPRLEVTQQPQLRDGRGVALAYTQALGDEAPARISIRVPAAYAFHPSPAYPPGTRIGVDQIQTNPPLGPYGATGLLTLEDRSAFAAESLACTDSRENDAVWAAHIGSSRGALPIPIFVKDRTLTLCPDPVKLGGVPTAIALQLLGHQRGDLVAAPATPGSYVWSALVTRAGEPEVEIRAIVDLPQRLTLAVRRVRPPHTVRVSGRLTSAGRGVSRATITITMTSSPRRRSGPEFRVRTRANGRFSVPRRVPSGTWDVQLRAFVESRDVTASACGGSTAPGGCVSATRNGFGLESAAARVTIRS